MKQSYEAWKKRVDDVLWAKYGLSSEDLPDVAYFEWYNEGVSPTAAAARAVKNAL